MLDCVRPRSLAALGLGRLPTLRKVSARMASAGRASPEVADTRRPFSATMISVSITTVTAPMPSSTWTGSSPARHAQSLSQSGRAMMPSRWAANITASAPTTTASSRATSPRMRTARARSTAVGTSPSAAKRSTTPRPSAARVPSVAATNSVPVTSRAPYTTPSSVAPSTPTMAHSRRRERARSSPTTTPHTAPMMARVVPEVLPTPQDRASAATPMEKARSGWRTQRHHLPDTAGAAGLRAPRAGPPALAGAGARHLPRLARAGPAMATSSPSRRRCAARPDAAA